MVIYKRPGTKYLWVRIEHDGRVVQRSSKKTTKHEAKEFEAALRVDEFGPGGLPEGQQAVTLAEFTKTLYPYWTRNCTSRTAAYYKDYLKPVVEFAQLGNCPLHRIDQRAVEAFFTARLALGYAIVTANHSIRALRCALHIAADKLGILRAAPKLSLLKNEHVREAVVDEADFQRIIGACDRPAEQISDTITVKAGAGRETLRALFTLLYDGGLRAGEAVNLEWRNVNLAERWIFVEKGKSKLAKRKVGLTARVVTALSGLKEQARPGVPFVFTRYGGRAPITVGWASHAFTRARRSLKLPDGVVLHSFRHSCATRLGNRGANVLDLQKIMGWSSPVIASKYVHLDESRMQALTNLLEV